MHRIGALRSILYSVMRSAIAELLRILATRWVVPIVLGGVGLLTAAGVVQSEVLFRGLVLCTGLGLLVLGGLLWIGLYLWPIAALCLLPGLLTLWFAWVAEVRAPWPFRYRAIALLFGMLDAATAWLLLETAVHHAGRIAWNWRKRLRNAVAAFHAKAVQASLRGPFILFLRYYRTEVPRTLRGYFRAADLQSTRATVVLDYLSRRDSATLPIVALHNSAEFVHHDNLVVFYATNRNWLSVAQALIENATAIVFMMDTAPAADEWKPKPAEEVLGSTLDEFATLRGSSGLSREAMLIRDGGHLGKTLVVHAEVAADSPTCVIDWFDPITRAKLSGDDLHEHINKLARARAQFLRVLAD